MPIWHQSPKLTPRYFLETPRLFGYPVLRAEKKEMTFEQMCKKYNVCRTTLYKILKSGDLHE